MTGRSGRFPFAGGVRGTWAPAARSASSTPTLRKLVMIVATQGCSNVQGGLGVLGGFRMFLVQGLYIGLIVLITDLEAQVLWELFCLRNRMLLLLSELSSGFCMFGVLSC